MATFRTLKSGNTQATIRLKGFDKSKSFKTKRLAQSWAKDYEKQIKQASTMPDSAIIQKTPEELADLDDIFKTLGIDTYGLINDRNLSLIEAFTPEAAMALSAKEIDQHGGPELFQHANVDIRYKSFKEAAREYLKQWSEDHKDVKNQTLRINDWIDIFGNKIMTEITIHTVRKVIDEMLVTGSRPATVLRKKAVLSSLFKYCLGRGYIDSNPSAHVVVKNDVKTRERVLTASERDDLLAACKQSPWIKMNLLVTLAITTGARKSELLNLSWNDVDLKNRVASLSDTKNGDDRVLSIPQPAINELKQFQEIGSGLIFPSAINPSKPLDIRKAWDAVVDAAGLNNEAVVAEKGKFVFHLLRHGFCSALSNSGIEINEIAKLAGHKSIQTTMRYIHQDNKRKQAITDTLAQAMGL